MKFYLSIIALALAASPSATLAQEARAFTVLPKEHGNKLMLAKDVFPSVEECQAATASLAEEQKNDADSKGVIYFCLPADLATATDAYFPIQRLD